MTREEAIEICLDALREHEDGSNEYFEVFDRIKALCEQEPCDDHTWHLMRHCSPPESKDILVCDIDGDVYYTRLNVCDGVCRYFDTGGDKIKNIVAWMPLPEPYKVESEGD